MKKWWGSGGLCFALLIVLTGCDVPKAYQIANTVNPKDEDVDVRFRTTYYLRVFDLCRVGEDGKENQDGKKNQDGLSGPKYAVGMAGLVHRTDGHYRVIKDSLYRFRMTGQAQAFFNNVRFESGTLRDYQVDPFGTTIAVDKKYGQFQPSDCVKNGKGSEVGDCGPARSKATMLSAKKDNPCPEGEVKDAKFYLLGPEGIKELERSERLVMAMSTDAKPLISALQRVGGIKAQVETEAAGQYRVKRNRARAEVALDKLKDAKSKITAQNPGDATTSPEALEATILNIFREKEGTQ